MTAVSIIACGLGLVFFAIALEKEHHTILRRDEIGRREEQLRAVLNDLHSAQADLLVAATRYLDERDRRTVTDE